jgi:hypothetical protein
VSAGAGTAPSPAKRLLDKDEVAGGKARANTFVPSDEAKPRGSCAPKPAPDREEGVGKKVGSGSPAARVPQISNVPREQRTRTDVWLGKKARGRFRTAEARARGRSAEG